MIVSVVGTIGKTAIVPKSFAGCNLVRATALIDIEDELMSKWVKYYFDSPCGQSYIEQNLNTTVQPTLNIKSLVEMPIPIRDTTEMEKNVLLLSALDEKIEVNRQINDNLLAQAKVIKKQWVATNEDGYEMLPLADVAAINPDTYSPKEAWEYVNYLDTSSITDGFIADVTLFLQARNYQAEQGEKSQQAMAYSQRCVLIKSTLVLSAIHCPICLRPPGLRT